MTHTTVMLGATELTCDSLALLRKSTMVMNLVTYAIAVVKTVKCNVCRDDIRYLEIDEHCSRILADLK